MTPKPKFFPGEKVLLIQALEEVKALICTVVGLICYPDECVYTLEISLDKETFFLIKDVKEEFLEKYYE